jgi:hypothetical protein
MLGGFSLLLKLLKVNDLQFIEFCKILTHLCDYLWTFSNQVTV